VSLRRPVESELITNFEKTIEKVDQLGREYKEKYQVKEGLGF
jgi:hypothetical protein